MYRGEDFDTLNSKAEWLEVTYLEYLEVRKGLSFRPDNLYIRDHIDQECTEWTGIMQYCRSTMLPYFKYISKGDIREFYINSKVITRE